MIMIYDPGSFEWYLEYNDIFIDYLAVAIMRANVDNLNKLSDTFFHICEAYKMPDHKKSPNTLYPATMNTTTSSAEPINLFEGLSMDGSFHRYLFNSGDFVKNLARAVYFSDEYNIRLLSKHYPQMVSAYLMPNSEWDMCPKGFESDTYNSPQKTP